ncbi:MAG: response regulator, partial [Proteobacteria bacterium]
LSSGLQEIIKTLQFHKSNVTLAAADYLRRFLTERKLFESRVALEQNLLATFPGSGKLLVNMAEAEILTGKHERAWSLLNHAELIDDRLSGVCKHLREKFFKGDGPHDSTTRENTLGIKNVILIDPDTDVLRAVSDMLIELGVNSIETFEDGTKALDHLIVSDPKPDLIFMEWRIPGISGPMLVQRIRHAGLVQVPIIISSSLIKKEEKPLLSELGVDEVLEKPFDRSSFFGTLVWAIQQNKMPTEQKPLERKFRRLIQAKKLQEAELILAQIVGDFRIDEGSKRGLQAEYLYEMGEYKDACKLGVEALKVGGDTLAHLNLIGKILLKLNQHEKALQCFDKANSICSLNIERIITISEIHLKLGHKQEAIESIQPALALDGTNPEVLETKLKIDLETGNMNSAKKIAKNLNSMAGLASYINNRAIALARSGQFEEGIALYKRAIHCLEAESPEMATFVKYNLGLSYARSGNYQASADVLKACVQISSPNLKKKVEALLHRVENASRSGEALFPEGLSESSSESADAASGLETLPQQISSTQLGEMLANASAKKGDLGCYLIFNQVEDTDPRSSSLMAKEIHYTIRKIVVVDANGNESPDV